MKYVIGVDLGTSGVKVLLVNKQGEVVQEVVKTYPLQQPKPGYNEQDPEQWVSQTLVALTELLDKFSGDPQDIEGLSFAGQMHGLVLLDQNKEVLRPAILWNDTRTTEECQEIYDAVGEEQLLKITKNPALEGFTLPKILWVRKHEPKIYKKAERFLLPKDYVRFRLIGSLEMDYSDAAGTLLLDLEKNEWSEEVCQLLEIDRHLCPPLVPSHAEVGTILPEVAKDTGLSKTTRVFAGGADNACGAIGAGVLEEGKTLCSIGTSGVILSYEADAEKDFSGTVHYFNHASPNAFYTMGVTLAAGYSLDWFKETFAKDESFAKLLQPIDSVPIGSGGLLFTPYIVGERTPHADASIRGSFIGIDQSQRKEHFVRAVLEGITFSLHESIDIFRQSGKKIDTIVSIGGGGKNSDWLQMQADIFKATILKPVSEQGPGMGAAMLAAYGCEWFDSLADCAEEFLQIEKVYKPIDENVRNYEELFSVYQNIYGQTKEINQALGHYRI